MAIVACPICGRSVIEKDINLHLDLQCSGSVGPSTSTSDAAGAGADEAPITTLEKAVTKPPETDGVIHILDDSPAPVRVDRRIKPISKVVGGNVAPIFSKRGSSPTKGNGREEAKVPSTESVSTGGGVGRGMKRPNDKKDEVEKKPRLNPLLANQP
jgi:putative ATPase